MNPEQAFWNSIRDKMPGFTQRIETSTGNGVPDVYGCILSLSYWLELKVWTENVGILLRKEQWAWSRNLLRHNFQRIFVLVQLQDTKLVMLLPVKDILVEAYGESNKYVKIITPDLHLFTSEKVNLKETLIKNIFTIK